MGKLAGKVAIRLHGPGAPGGTVKARVWLVEGWPAVLEREIWDTPEGKLGVQERAAREESVGRARETVVRAARVVRRDVYILFAVASKMWMGS